MQQRRDERNLSDIRSLTEALGRALEDAHNVSRESAAEQLGVRRAYLSDALNPDRDELQFQARHLLPYCRIVGPLPLAWIADQLGYVLVKREHAASASDIALETLDVQDRVGHLSAKVRCAMADGVIDQYEQADIREEARRVQREAAEVERAVEALPIQIARRA
jgi:hypothetical protein